MSRAPVATSLRAVRRLAVTRQHLAGKPTSGRATAGVLAVVRDLAYVQWDPVSIVAPSHLLSLWARLGPRFRASALERMLWKEKLLFEHWTPMASLVLTEDYPLFLSLMRRYPESLTRSWGNQRLRAKRFLARNAALRATILTQLRRGPRSLGEFEEHGRTRRKAGDWGFPSDVAQMLYHLTMSGDIMVVGRRGNTNLWGLAERFLPRTTPREELSAEAFERAAAQRALRALGTATPREITLYFPRGRYDHLSTTLERLEAESTIHPVTVDGSGSKERRYVHDLDLPLLASLETGGWRPRLSLLPPFDNMLADRGRTQRLFGFDYVREQFLPKAKRRFGTYVLPILWGDRFVGRLDPRFDKATGRLFIQAAHAEADAPGDAELTSEIGRAVERLARSIGADEVVYPEALPPVWKRGLG